MLPHKVRREGFQRSQFFQNTTVINTPTQSKLFCNWGTVEWNYLYPGNCGPLEKLSSHGLSAFLNQDCAMLNWLEITPYTWRLTLHHSNLSSGVISAPDVRLDLPELTYWRNALILGQKTFVLSVHTIQLVWPNSCAVLEPDSIPSRTFIQYMTVVWELPAFYKNAQTLPRVHNSCTLESHLSSSVFSTTWCVLL